MPSSDRRRPLDGSPLARLLRRRGVGTALLTLALGALFVLIARLLRLTVYGALGFEYVVAPADLWRLFLARLPSPMPGILGPTPLAVGLVVATLALAYMIAATLRLPE
jgi:hypothetical protein